MMQKLTKEQFMELYKEDTLKKQRDKDKEYYEYHRYKRINYKKVMRNYFGSKYRDKNKLLK